MCPCLGLTTRQEGSGQAAAAAAGNGPQPSRLCCTGGSLPWRPAWGCWQAGLRPGSVPLVGSRWGRHRWSGRLSIPVVLVRHDQGVLFSYGGVARSNNLPLADSALTAGNHAQLRFIHFPIGLDLQPSGIRHAMSPPPWCPDQPASLPADESNLLSSNQLHLFPPPSAAVDYAAYPVLIISIRHSLASWLIAPSNNHTNQQEPHQTHKRVAA